MGTPHTYGICDSEIARLRQWLTKHCMTMDALLALLNNSPALLHYRIERLEASKTLIQAEIDELRRR